MEELNISGVDEKYYLDETSSGLPIIMWVNDKVNNFYITLNCKYGSIDTEFSVQGENYEVPNGVAHFLEHVNFALPGGSDATDYFSELGSSSNAFTTTEYTSYEVFASSNFKENLEHLLNFIFIPYFTEANVKKEKGIITEEVKMGKNNPGHVFYYGANECIYVKDKRKNLVTGEVEDVKKTTKEDLELVYNTFYHPKNMFLVITGNFNPFEAAAIVKENMNSKEFASYQEPVKKRVNEPVMVNIPFKEETGNVELPKLKVTYKIDRDNFKNLDDLELRIYTGMILRNNFGATSLFKEELLENELITMLSYEREINSNILIISIIAETKYPTEVIDKIRNQMENLAINNEDLTRRKRCNIAALINDYDDIEYVNSEIQDSIITYGEIKADMFDVYNNCKVDIANKVIKGINTENESIYILKSKKSSS